MLTIGYKGTGCSFIVIAAGRYPLGIAVSRKREPSARICCAYLTNLRFSPDVGQKKEQTKSKDLICSLWCRWSGSNRHGIATTGF